MSSASQGLLSTQPGNVSVNNTTYTSRSNSDQQDRSTESEHRRENANISRGTTAESPLMPAHVLSSRSLNNSSNAHAGTPVIPVSRGD